MTNDNIISLGEVRAHQNCDARHWTPLEALKSLVRQIEAGELNPCAVSAWYWDSHKDGSTSLHYAAAGLTYEQHIAMLSLAHHKTVADWRT